MERPTVWDIFCTVIDNHGDIGVCWRLAVELAGRGHRVRLWVDDASALAWMAPGGCPGVELRTWSEAEGIHTAPEPATEALVEAFGCEIPQAFLAATVQARTGQAQPAWINLEYLSAESYVERSHGLPSPVMSGPARGWTKHFFYPGFTPRTGGLLREPDLSARQAAFERERWLAGLGISPPEGGLLASLFCYEPPALPGLLDHWQAQGHQGRPVTLLVTPGKAQAAVNHWRPAGTGLLRLVQLPWLSQRDFDHLLWACDLNLVRGEDSLVRALWAGQPLVWQLYPQDDGAHVPKLQAFLDTVGATDAARAWHAAWNPATPTGPAQPWAYPDATAWQAWQAQARACGQALAEQSDLATQLIGFVAKSG